MLLPAARGPGRSRLRSEGTVASVSPSSVVILGNDSHASSGAGRCQRWLQRSAIELVPRQSRQPGDDLAGTPSAKAFGDERGDRVERVERVTIVVDAARRASRRPEDERDLALRCLRKPLREL